MLKRNHCLHHKCSLSAYIDKELSPQLMTEVEEHLASCPDCQAEFNSLCAVMEALTILKAPEPQPSLDTAVMRRIRQRRKIDLWQRLIPAPLCAAAIGLLVGVFLASGTIQQSADSMIASDDGIMRAMDIFSPSPQGSFSGTYFAMIDNLDR